MNKFKSFVLLTFSLIFSLISCPLFAADFKSFVDGQSEVVTAILSLPKSTVAELLPADLSLVSVPFVPEDSHPVLFSYAHQQNSEKALWPFDYNEGTLLIPNVSVKGHAGIYTYIPQLLVDNSLAVSVGRSQYGFDKILAKFFIEPGSVLVKDKANQKILLSFTKIENRTGSVQFFNNVQNIKNLLLSPMISFKNDSAVCSILQWNFHELDNSYDMGGTSLSLSTTEEYIEGLSPLKLDLEPLENWQIGEPLHHAYHFSADWALSYPLSPETCTNGEKL